MNGRGTPMTGSTPVTIPMLMNAWPTSQVTTPAVARRTKGSRARRMTRAMARAMSANRARISTVPSRPSSSPMIEKM
ncbi:hypothetical protein AUQ48_13220 [Kocuria flava]|uniref:Uncharacterized protein n=1 Tax=Kocuria flava TaxID=446860 RepID=A0A2N4T458_9MICC|nr:hypothetical protein AUQ48_13220 [Kocuria flava]